MTDFLLFFLLVGIIIVVALLVYILRSIITETTGNCGKHWYYIVYICEKYKTCQPDFDYEFFCGTPRELTCRIGNKPVQTIIKLD